MFGEFAGELFIEAGGLAVIFLGGGVFRRVEEGEGGGGLAGEVADQFFPGFRAGAGGEELGRLVPGLLGFGNLPEDEAHPRSHGQHHGHDELGREPGRRFGLQNPGLFGRDGLNFGHKRRR